MIRVRIRVRVRVMVELGLGLGLGLRLGLKCALVGATSLAACCGGDETVCDGGGCAQMTAVVPSAQAQPYLV